MKLLHKPAVSHYDFLFGAAGFHAEDIAGLALRHLAREIRARTGLAVRLRLPLSLLL